MKNINNVNDIHHNITIANNDQDNNNNKILTWHCIKDNILYPPRLYVSGLPFWCGFNGIFFRSDEIRNGKPVYFKTGYRVLCFIFTKSVEIYYFNDCWNFREINSSVSLSKNIQLFGSWHYYGYFFVAPDY